VLGRRLPVQHPRLILQRAESERPAVQRRRGPADRSGGLAGQRKHVGAHMAAEGISGLAAPLVRTCSGQSSHGIGEHRGRPAGIGRERLVTRHVAGTRVKAEVRINVSHARYHGKGPLASS
jgi:hypothetical protein